MFQAKCAHTIIHVYTFKLDIWAKNYCRRLGLDMEAFFTDIIKVIKSY